MRTTEPQWRTAMRPLVKAAIRGCVVAVAMMLAAPPASAADVRLNPGEGLAAQQTFAYSVPSPYASLDPHLAESATGHGVVRNLFEGLFIENAAGEIAPGVALTFDADAQHQRYTFHLRKTAQWSDGQPVRAQDFIYAWRRAVDPATASPYAWLMELTKIENAAAIVAGEKAPETLGVRAVDDHTLEVSLSESVPYFALMTAHPTLMPVPRRTIEQHGANWTAPNAIVVNGAYTLVESAPTGRTVLERNPLYWDDGRTVIDIVGLFYVTDDDLNLNAYLDGRLDLIDVPPKAYPAFKDRYGDQVHTMPRLCSYWYTFNLGPEGPEAFKDLRVRKALSFAIDRRGLIDQTLKGGQFPAYTLTPAATGRFTPPATPFATLDQGERDRLARELLASAGYGPDNPLTFTMLYNTSPGHTEIAQAMADMWAEKLGVKATLKQIEWRTFLETRSAQNFDLARGAWCGDYNEASTFLDLMVSSSGYNDGRYASDKVDELMAGSKTMADPSLVYQLVEEILTMDMPIIPLYHYSDVKMINPKLRGWPVNNAAQMWYAKDLYKVD